MAYTISTYKGLKRVTPTPSGEGGQALNDNFTYVADNLESIFSLVDEKLSLTGGTMNGNLIFGSPYGVTVNKFWATGANTPISFNTPSTFSLALNVNAYTFSTTSTQASNSFNAFRIAPTYNQTSGTAANTDLLIDRTQTAVGSGNQYLINAQVGGSARFNVSADGIVSASNGFANSISPGNRVTIGHDGGSLIGIRSLSNATFAIQSNISGSTVGGSAFLIRPSNVYTQTSGNNSIVSITASYNQTSGTAANTDLLINRTETAIGSGAQYLLDLQVGGSSKFNVTNTGNTGIGLTPSEKLDVSGNIKGTGSTMVASHRGLTQALGNSTGAIGPINPNSGEVVTMTLTGNVTVSIDSGSSTYGQKLILKLTQDGTGGRTLTWGGSNVKAPSGVTPQPVSSGNAISQYELTWNGTEWALTNFVGGLS